MNPSRRTFEVVEGLLRRGWKEADVEGVLGGNFRRALAAIWEAQAAVPPARPPRPAPPQASAPLAG